MINSTHANSRSGRKLFGNGCELGVRSSETVGATAADQLRSLPLYKAFGKDVGIYLLAGPSGARKSGFALQLAIDRGISGSKSLLVLSEETPTRIVERAHRMLAGSSAAEIRRALGNVSFEPAPHDPAALTRQIEQWVLRPDGRHGGVNLVIVDSIQGGAATSGADAVACRSAIDTAKMLQRADVTSLLVGHVTKQNAVRGPRSLEHAVDVVLRLDRRGGRRTLSIPKNRFGPALLRPMPLTLDPITTRLATCTHVTTQVTTARAFIPGIGLAEIQAAAALPPDGSHGRLGPCRGIPRDEAIHAVACLAGVPTFEDVIAELNLSAACRLPSGDVPAPREVKERAAVLHLPLCLALAGACLGRDVGEVVAAGEADLAGRLRSLPGGALAELAAALRAGELRGARLLCPAPDLKYLPWNCECKLVGVETVEDAVRRAWPEMDLDALCWSC